MLAQIEVAVVDCQASGATPRHGAVLELGWAVAGPGGYVVPVEAWFVAPPDGTRVSRAVRELTGWSEACLAQALSAGEAWTRFVRGVRATHDTPVPCVIHFARFERGFLQDLHQRLGHGPFPLDIVCLHEVARRLFPELPRRNLRALAGFLGHSPTLVRRSAGHVDASAFIWQAALPALAAAGVHTWDQLTSWLQEKAPPRARRTYPMPAARRRALPDQPGVYRFLRRNGDVVYVGKAISLKKRVATHFTGSARATERALEMLTQVHDIDVTPCATVLEAALLETDEIKRLDPPYNVQLREGDRRAWFASADLSHAVPAPDDVHRLGPLPSARALSSLGAIRALASGADPMDRRLGAAALGVPVMFAPDEELFQRAWDSFRREHLGAEVRNPWHGLLRASRHVVPGESADETPPDVWDFDRVRRHLDRALLRGGQLVRRARWLVLLSDANVAFREARGDRFRLLVVERGEVVERGDLSDPRAIPGRGTLRSWQVRQAAIDAARYDRLRVLATELARIHTEGGAVALGIGDRVIADRRAGFLVV